jgi:transketolase
MLHKQKFFIENMDTERLKYLADQAIKVREHIIRMSTDGGCFIGASLSCADIMVYLYNEYLDLKKENLDHPDRNYLLLSKGHDVPAMYGTFVEIGWLESERLKNHLKTSDSIYWHPNRNIPGVEFHSGSLGHIPAVAAGIAMDCKIRGSQNKILAIVGDGELNEGSVWETLLVASAYQLDNLIIVVDRNAFQANVATEDLIPLEPLAQKFEAFGCAVKRVDGHDFEAMDAAFKSLPYEKDKPSVVICDTLRGKGLPSIEKRADRWFVNFAADEIEGLLKELHGDSMTELHSETLTVR